MTAPASARFLVAVVALGLAACGGGRGAGPGAPPGPGPLPGPGELLGDDVRLDTDDADELSLASGICCEGDTVYVVWGDRRDRTMDVYFSRSLDRGATWLASDRRLNTNGPGASQSQIPVVCCSGDAVYVAWYDDRDGQNDIYFNRSLDRGATWLAQDVRVDTDPGAGQAREPRICCDGSSVYVVWRDDRDGSWDIRANRSLDGGTTWLVADVRVDRDPTLARSEVAHICCSGPQVYVVWIDERNGGRDLYFNGSADAGASFGADDVRLNELDAATGDASAPSLCCDGARVYVAWHDGRDGFADIRGNRSLDGGATWLPQDVRLDRDAPGAEPSAFARLCCEGDEVYAVWEDMRNGVQDVYFSRSTDAGATWSLLDVRLDTDGPGVSTSFRPDICCAEGRLYVGWYDDRNGRFDVLLRHSPDAGRTWLAPELRADTDEEGSGHSIFPLLCCEGEDVYVAWHDQRAGPGDVYFNTARFADAP